MLDKREADLLCWQVFLVCIYIHVPHTDIHFVDRNDGKSSGVNEGTVRILEHTCKLREASHQATITYSVLLGACA